MRRLPLPSLARAVGRAPARRPRALLLAALGATLAALAPDVGAQARPRPGTLPGTRPAPLPPAPGQPGTGAPPAAPRPAAPAPGTKGWITMRGLVWDSLANQPLAGAIVQVANADDPSSAFSAESDSLGEYRITGLTPGRWIAGFFHRAADGLGVELAPLVARLGTDSLAILDFGTPGPRRLRAQLCPQADPGAPMLLGLVRDAESGTAVEGARVVLTWSETRIEEASSSLRRIQRRMPVRTRPDGGYVACGLPVDLEIEAGAEAPKRIAGGIVPIALRAGAVLRQDLTIGDSLSVTAVVLPDTNAARENRPAMPRTVARGNARIVGTVRAPDGQPLQGARVVVWGTGVEGVSGANGAFSLGGLPSGTYSLEVRAIGFTPKKVIVDLSAKRPQQLALRLDSRVTALSSVQVRERATSKSFSEFEERMKRGSGFGRFITEEDILRRNPLQMSEVLRVTPGIQVVPRGGGLNGNAILGRGGCQPTVFVDGTRAIDGAVDLDDIVRPQDVAGVEVYGGSAGVPPQFMMGSGGCGVVAIWTKRGGPRPAASGAR